MTTKNEGHLSIDPDTFGISYLKAFEKEDGNLFLKIPFQEESAYQELYAIFQAINISKQCILEVNSRKDISTPEKIINEKAISMLEMVVEKINLEKEFEGLDYLKSLAELYTQKSN